jgi:peroxiredoxin Q/BCP
MNLKPGDKAPAFSAPDQNGQTLTLKDFAGKKLVLYFYPKDDTPGCTAEALLGVSPDNEKKHQKFIAKYELPFSLLADTDNKVATDYGVWVEKSMYGRKYMGIARTTFVIDEKGNISEVIEKVETAKHAAQILK